MQFGAQSQRPADGPAPTAGRQLHRRDGLVRRGRARAHQLLLHPAAGQATPEAPAQSLALVGFAGGHCGSGPCSPVSQLTLTPFQVPPCRGSQGCLPPALWRLQSLSLHGRSHSSLSSGLFLLVTETPVSPRPLSCPSSVFPVLPAPPFPPHRVFFSVGK